MTTRIRVAGAFAAARRSAIRRRATGTLRCVSASCSRPGCGRAPVATLTYDYAASAATIDHLAAPHPMQYDLCELHAERLSVPNGWALVDQRVDQRVTAPVVDIQDRRAS